MTDPSSPDPLPGAPGPAPDVPGPGPSDPDPGPPVAADPRRSGVDALVEIERELTAVDAALLRLDDGTYGTCLACGGPIDDDRLAQDPTEVRCAGHAAPPAGPDPSRVLPGSVGQA